MARGFIQGDAERGGNIVTTDGRSSVTLVQKSFPFATVTVFNAGTAVVSTIFSTEGGAAQANPFLADANGHWSFWADQARYDVQFSGAGIPAPYTLFSIETIVAAGLVDPGSNGFLARTSPNVLAARTFLGTTSAIVVSNGSGGADPIINLDTSLLFTGKTITGGSFITPTIANFSSAQHNHESAVGAGQLNATNVFSAGIVPIPRLPAMVGATGVSNGTAGLVPQPLIGDESKFLRGDGTYQTAGGGGGSPGGANTTIQFNNSGVFGGVSGATSDATNITFGSTNLRATRPRIITSIDDTNGNEVIGLISVGSAVNEVSIANAGTGVGPTISTTGDNADINLNVSLKGAGIIASAANLQISNNAPNIVLVDVNDSKTVRISLSGANWAFINDTVGHTPLNIDTTSGDITTIGNLFFAKAGAITIGRPSQTDLTLSNSTGVYTFGQIPVLPASDPTTDNQAVRRKFVTDSVVPFSHSFFIADVATYPLNAFGIQEWIVPPNTEIKITQAELTYNAGSASGTFTAELRKRTGGTSTETTIATFSVTGSLAVFAKTTDTSPDFALTAGDSLYVKLTARSSPLQLGVSIAAQGTNKRIT